MTATAIATATARCGECHAAIAVPPQLDATTMRCGYCGLDQPVPDLGERRRALLEHEREARLYEQQRRRGERDARRDAHARRERDEDRRDARRGRRWGVVVSLVSALAAPLIIAVTVYDLPARLGFGASGADRLEQLSAQLTGSGCTVLSPIASLYATANVSRLIAVRGQCVRVLAAGGSGHGALSLRLFASDGSQVGFAGSTSDPQLKYCTPSDETLRYEIGVAPAAKGRLSHLVLACPAAAPARPRRR